MNDSEKLAAIVAALTVRPCHVTGLHSPEHHLRYSCDIQKADTLDRVLAAIGTTYDELPKELHPGDLWCHSVPSQEQYREGLRQTYRWAGVDIPEELAALAPDAPRPGDEERVLAAIEPGDRWQPWQEVTKRIRVPEKHPNGWDGMATSRYWTAVAALHKAGRIERHDIVVRLPQEEAQDA